MDDIESSFATCPTEDGRLRVGIVDPKLGTMENDKTVCYATLSPNAVLGLVKDCMDWLVSINDVPELNHFNDKSDGT